MSDTPRTDENLAQALTHENGSPALGWMARDMRAKCKELERELNAAKSAISGRTVSCSNCNALAAENAEMRATIQIIYDAAECCADGAPDASDHDKLCNELTHSLKPYLK